jgi:hypothetical protein
MKKNILIWIIIIVIAAGAWWCFKDKITGPAVPESETLSASDDTTSITNDLEGLNDTSTLVDDEFQSIDKDLNNL